MYHKNVKTIEQDYGAIETKKMAAFKDQNNQTAKQSWNRAKRSITEGDARKKSKLFSA